MKEHIEAFDYAREILAAIPKGVLVTAKADGRVNPMTIGWGTMGIEWGKPIFTVFIRESRYTRELLDKNPAFTVSVPMGAYDKNILCVCGTKSGRDMDKVDALHLTLEEPEAIGVPGIRELPLTLECRVIYRQPQNPADIPQEIANRFYPQKDGSDGDYHIAYYGQIVAAYIIRD